MSYTAINWATKQETKSSIDKLLLIVLCDYANTKNQCFPNLETLSKLCCCSKTPIQKAVKRLVAGKFISVQKVGKGMKKSNLYTVNANKSSGVKSTTNIIYNSNKKFIRQKGRNKNFIAG